MKIEVCGPGCARCYATKENVQKAASELQLKEGEGLELLKIEDYNAIAARGVMLTPGVLIDGVKVSEGRVPEPKEIKKWIEERLGSK